MHGSFLNHDSVLGSRKQVSNFAHDYAIQFFFPEKFSVQITKLFFHANEELTNVFQENIRKHIIP